MIFSDEAWFDVIWKREKKYDQARLVRAVLALEGLEGLRLRLALAVLALFLVLFGWRLFVNFFIDLSSISLSM